MIPRTALAQIEKGIRLKPVTLITGARQTGKTTLCKVIAERHGFSYVSLADRSERMMARKDPDMFLSVHPAPLIIDEVQYAITKKELRNTDNPPVLYGVLNGLLRRGNVDVYVTGSNSKMLSKDVLTEFRGRGDEVHVMPLSFSEFMQAFGGDRYEGWAEYVMFGGLPALRAMRTDEQKARYLTSLFHEVYLKDVVARNGVEKSQELDDLVDIQLSSGKISALLNPLTYAIINLAIAVLINAGRDRFDLGLIEAGSIIALVNYMSQILTELIKLANLIITISRAVASWKRIERVFETQPTMAEAENGYEEDGESDEAVSFRNVSVVYRGGGEPSLRNADFTVKRGERIGIIGGTGAGKTTIVSMIPRLYDPTDGVVSVLGHSTAAWKIAALRSRIGYVQQKAVLFKGTIRENIAWGKPDASEAEVDEALRSAEAYDFVMEKKNGVNTMIEEGGKNLSGGQRQRLSIARALIRKPEILILDDSSSALDYATEARLRHNLAQMEGMTVFTVSQRTSSLMNMDRIIVVDKGNIVDIGTHEELLDRCSVYKEIYDSQFGGADEKR